MFFEASSRLYWPLLLSSALFALCYVRKDLTTHKILKSLIHRDSLIDLTLLVTNTLLKMFFFSFFALTAATLAMPIVMMVHNFFPGLKNIQIGLLSSQIYLTLFVLFVDDFLRFSHHVLMHKYLWKLHRIHHSARKLTPLTLFRTHPLESLIASIRSLLTHTITIIFMVLFFKNQMGVYEFLGVNIFGFIFNATLANLRHSHIPVSFGILEYIFISPRMHQLHHSSDQKHFNKNFGVIFSLWDHLYGSFYRPSPCEIKSMKFGLAAYQELLLSKNKNHREGLFQGIAKITPALTKAKPIISLELNSSLKK